MFSINLDLAVGSNVKTSYACQWLTVDIIQFVAIKIDKTLVTKCSTCTCIL